MVTLAFKVKHGSDFYKQYFAAKDEKEKFRQMAVNFTAKLGIDGDIYVSERLCVKPLIGKRFEYYHQTLAKPDKNGFYWFKKKSITQELWDADIVPKVNWECIKKMDLWWWGHIQSGTYSLWDHDGEIYGYLEDRAQKDITPADFMEPMKMSEYYAVIENYEECPRR